MRCRVKSLTLGSNPSLSAKQFVVASRVLYPEMSLTPIVKALPPDRFHNLLVPLTNRSICHEVPGVLYLKDRGTGIQTTYP